MTIRDVWLFRIVHPDTGKPAQGVPVTVLDAWLPLVHKGYWGLIAGVVVAIGAFQTARTRVCPINGLLGVNTAAGSSA